MSQDQNFFEDLMIKFLYIKKSVRDKIIPYLSPDLFNRDENKEIVYHINKFMEKYDKFPSINDSILKLKETPRNHLKNGIMMIDSDQYDDDVLLDELELFIKEKLVSNICYKTIMSLDTDDGLKSVPESPDKLREAYAFSFDANIGLKLFCESERMYQHLHSPTSVIPTPITLLNQQIGGGVHTKSLTLFMAETNMGKSLVMSSFAVSNILANKNVLYISCELSEDETGVRMLANLWDISINDLKTIPKETFFQKYEEMKIKFGDKLIIREYAPKSINANTIRTLLKELELRGFIPDVVYLDQIGNMNSIYKVRSDNTYTEMGKVTQEVRGVALDYNIPIISVIQTNRDGFGASEVDLSNAGDSIGFVQTADLVISITQSEEFRAQRKYIWQILKNRFGINKGKMTVRVIYDKMKVYDDESSIFEKEVKTDDKKQKIKKAESVVNEIKTKEINNIEKKILKWE